MQVYTNMNSTFPDQIVSEAEKATLKYGLAVGRAIEGEWFNSYKGAGVRFSTNYNTFHTRRLYARGEQSVQKYKDEMSINGDLSYLNLDWKPVPIIPKFVDIVVNGISQRNYEVKTFAQDPESLRKRTQYAQNIITDIFLKQYDEAAKESFGVDLRKSDAQGKNIPKSIDELSAHMQLDYKQSIELAEEELIDQVLDKNKYHLTRKRLNYDLTVLGIAAVKTTFNKIKETNTGLQKVIEKQDTFLEAEDNDNFKKAFRSIEVLYSGAKILGYEQMLRWEMSENMTRPEADSVKVNMSYSITAPRMYRGRIESLVSRITSFADMIQLTSLKLQQVLSRMVPDGVYLDMDGLAEVDLGNGTNYNPAEALNMYFQTGSIVGRSLTQDGDQNLGKVPIQELQSSSGGQKMQALIQTYQYYLQMIRDVTGLNEARDGSNPDPNSLVGLQKLAAANSNTATRHILQGSLYLTLKTCENISLRAADALMFPLTKMSLQNSISLYNVGTLDELAKLNIHDFGIFIQLEPDEEEKSLLEQNIQMALQKGGIDLEDAIDIRNINNLKLANELLKKRRQEKRKAEQAAQQANIQAQAQANAKASESAAMAEVQKNQALSETNIQFEQAKSQFDIQKLQTENELKKELMAQQFSYDQQLRQMELQAKSIKEKEIEERKDERVRIQGTQESKMIDQRKNGLLPTDFETNQPDNLGGDAQGEMMPQ